MDKKENTCEDCEHYRMIDSGYGHCHRYPPTLVVLGVFKKYVKDMTPVVAFTRKTCGEFRLKRK